MLKLLIVDDEDMIRMYLDIFFRRKGYEVFTANCGEEALRIAEGEKPHLMFLDMFMPKMSGMEVLKRIREKDKVIKVIMITGYYKDKEDMEQARKLGADEYILKPFEPEYLETEVISKIKIKLFDDLRKEVDEKSRLNMELKGLNATLEKKVEERTRELKEAQTQLVHSARLASVGQLAAGMAHEINTPLYTLRNCLEVIDKRIEKVKKEAHPAFIESIDLGRKSLERIQHLIDSLLGFSRKNREGMNYVDIRQGIEDTLVMIEHQLKGEIQVHREYGEIGIIEADLQQVNQVFMNLFTNAIYAIMARKEKIEDCGHLWIKICDNGEYITIIVKDDGLGIPKDIQDRIFDPFFTTKKVGEGTGLGLNISYRIIKDHNGTIDVESEENEGAVFKLHLPKRQKPKGGNKCSGL
ncbi:MAG: response regulator [bacterium]